MADRVSMDTSELEELEEREAQAKADAINARATWRTLQSSEEGSYTALWGALMRVHAATRNGVFERTTTLLETRETEMDTRCEPHLGGWPRVTGPIARADAIAMQTIVSSFVDALDSVNSVLCTMINALIDQEHRAIEAEAREATALDAEMLSAEKELAGPSENIAWLTADRLVSLNARLEAVDYAVKSHERLRRELTGVRDQLTWCRLARVQVLTYWRLGLKLEAELAKIAH